MAVRKHCGAASEVKDKMRDKRQDKGNTARRDVRPKSNRKSAEAKSGAGAL